jgi:hypothetical protein
MSRNQSIQQAAALAAIAAKARLVAKNKEAAREHLLRIQLLLAQRPILKK